MEELHIAIIVKCILKTLSLQIISLRMEELYIFKGMDFLFLKMLL
jgi:hypothetical protein